MGLLDERKGTRSFVFITICSILVDYRFDMGICRSNLLKDFFNCLDMVIVEVLGNVNRFKYWFLKQGELKYNFYLCLYFINTFYFTFIGFPPHSCLRLKNFPSPSPYKKRRKYYKTKTPANIVMSLMSEWNKNWSK